ncbi:hypothetical protein [Acidisoma sp.]|uniref:hypothetical protein n=1 Tax=Acidisoma sp. TaxID=1872115 RepID=UPI003AFFA7AA
MHHLRSLAIASALLFAPPLITASMAQSSGGGSDVPPATARAAFPGATSNGAMGTSTGTSLSPTSGTGGGGMATASGMKEGGADKSRLKHHKTGVIPAP